MRGDHVDRVVGEKSDAVPGDDADVSDRPLENVG